MDDQTESNENNELSIQCLPFFFSHFFMFIIILICTLIGIICSNYQTVGPFHSANETLDFSPSYLSPTIEYPYYFSQLSDIHLTHGFPDRTKHILNVFTSLSNKIKPKLVILTGDITDASDSSKFLQPRKQYKLNWDEYNATLHQSGLLQISKILEIPGNHDIYNIESESSTQNYFPKYTQQKIESMNAQSYLIDNQFNFVMINPVKFPYLSAPLGMIPYTSTSILKEFEKHFITDDPNISNIIISHYPHTSTWTAHPNLMKQIYSKGRLFLSGHLHPDKCLVLHYGNLLSAITSPGYGDYTGLITIEKKMSIVYHQINPQQKEPIIVVSYPVPIEQLSNDQVFNIRNFPVRVIGFSNQPLDLNLFIDDVSIGKLSFNRTLNEGVTLYSCEVNSNLNFGRHSLKIEGDSKYKMDFYIGEESPKMKETINKFFTPQFFFGAVAAISFLILIRLIPFWLLCGDILDRYENYMYYGKAVTNRELARIFKSKELKDINSNAQRSSSEISISSENAKKTENDELSIENEENSETNSSKNNDNFDGDKTFNIKWYHMIYLGPLHMICRLRKVPLSIYIVLIIMFVWYIPLPFYFTKIESKLATLWCWGYISDNKLFKYNTPLWFLLFYDLMLLFPLIDIAGMSYEFEKLLILHKIEMVLFCIVMLIAIVAWIVVCDVAGGFFSIFTSFMLYFALFGVIFVFCRIFINKKKKVRMIFESSY